MRNSPFRSDSSPVFAGVLAGRRGGSSRASAALIVAVWTLLWVWMAAGVLVPLSRVGPPGAVPPAAVRALET